MGTIRLSYQELFSSKEPLLTLKKKGKEPLVKVLGVPFDFTATFRPGARFAPYAIRQAFFNLELYFPKFDVDLEDESLIDLGNLMTSSNTNEMLSMLEKVTLEIVNEGKTPAIIGGEHTLTYAAARELERDAAILIFDAHLDLRDEYLGLRVSHTTFLRRLIEERGAERTLHIGARAATKDEWRFAESNQLVTIPSRDLLSLHGNEKRITDFLKGIRKVYISIDLDVLDPAYIPAVSNPEPCGISTFQLLQLLYTLKDKEIIGFDVVELSPIYDSGQSAVVAAKVLAELIALTIFQKRKKY